MKQKLMRAARLHGIKDLRLEELPVPRPGPGELLVRVEACGICPTDARKYAIGIGAGEYPLNPGHEWVGLVEETGGISATTGGRPARLVRFRREVLLERPAPGLRLRAGRRSTTSVTSA